MQPTPDRRGNLALHRPHRLSSFRKISLGTWQTAYDPQVYGTLELRVDAALAYLERWRAATGRRLTLTHLMGKALALALARVPDANAVLRFNRPWRRRSIGIFFQVVLTDEGDDKVDLSGLTLYDVDQKDLSTLLDEFEQKVQAVRMRADPALEKTRGAFAPVPSLIMNPILKLLTLLCITFNLDLRRFGIPRDPFGSAMITNVGSLGLDVAYAPLVPYSGVPIILAVGEARRVPVVEGEQVVPGWMMKVNATFDHRLIDGYHAAVMSRTLRGCFAEPDRYFGPIPGAPSPT